MDQRMKIVFGLSIC